MNFKLASIGLIRSPHRQAEGTPIQPRWAAGIEGTVEVFPEFARDCATSTVSTASGCSSGSTRRGRRNWKSFPISTRRSAGLCHARPVPAQSHRPFLCAATWPSKGRGSAWRTWTCWTARRCWTSNPTRPIAMCSGGTHRVVLPVLAERGLPTTFCERHAREGINMSIREASTRIKTLAGVCANCPVCRRARQRQSGAAFWLVKRVETRSCPFCRAYERAHGNARRMNIAHPSFTGFQ